MILLEIFRKLFRLWHTVRNLKSRQILYQCYYRFIFRTNKVAMPVEKAERGQMAPLPGGMKPQDSQLTPIKQYTPPAHFEFLNLARDHFSANVIDWNYKDYGKLWTYNLNYFEFLRHPSLPTPRGEDLIIDWARQSEHLRDGWEPYPTSLRIVHWLQFFRERKREVFPLAELSLRRQYNDLWRKREYHLGGNHLLENAIALSLGAIYFRKEKQFERAAELLLEQLEEQYTQDGGHYERSPMYHCILLWRLLDLYSWQSAAGQHQLCYFEAIKINLVRQIGWLKSMLDARGNYPHFNDSTNGIAPQPKLLLDYAHQLGISATETPLSDSGYRHWRTKEIDLWIDAAPIGPDHIPGHGHADNLTFVMALNGQKIIVDPGISTYEKNERRRWERSTFAHNTVWVGEQNSSDVWAGFRVGKRAYTTIEADRDYHLTASHDGYAPPHQRTFILQERQLLINDQIGRHDGIARFHLAPGLDGRVEAHAVRLDGLEFNFRGRDISLAMDDYQYCSGFNQLRSAKCIVIKFRQTLESKIRWIVK